MKTHIVTILLALLILMSSVGSLSAVPKDILIGLKLYQGVTSNRQHPPEVVSSFSIKPLFIGELLPGEDEKAEPKEIKRIFRLNRVKLLADTRWGWPIKGEKVHVFTVNEGKKTFIIQTRMQSVKTFDIEVYVKKGRQKASLLRTGLSIPQEKSIVLGFEDSQKIPYFLSVRRGKNQETGKLKHRAEWLKEPMLPKIKHYVKPAVTEEMRKKRIGGRVVVIATINRKGEVINLEFVRGNRVLNKSVKDAVTRWVYEPFLENGQAKEVKFTVSIEFNLKQNQGEQVRTSAEKNWDFVPSIWPTRGYISDGFGYRKHPHTGKRVFHNGIDIAGRLSHPVRSTASGEVKKIGMDNDKGMVIIIDHLNGYETQYWHLLNERAVKIGQRVKKGELIGYIGNTGRSYGPHLHYEVRKDGKPVNPMDFILD